MPLSSVAAYNWKCLSSVSSDVEISGAGTVNVGRETSWFSSVRILTLSLSLGGLAACTWGSFHFGQGFAFTGFLYLILVVLAALYGGFWQATVISVAAAACLNYFFVPPIFSFVNSPANWVALGAFEFTALVISRLSLRAQLRAIEAIAGRRDMERLYETSRRILLLDSSGDAGSSITSLIREIFVLPAVQLYDALSGTTYESGENALGVGQQARDAYLLGEDIYDQAAKTWCCVLRLGARPVGGLALRDAGMTKLAATALASLSGIALERVRALQRESHAQAARQTEQLRTAVLDALAHQFKTPLTIARTASSGLLALGGLSELQTELVTDIDQQASKLDHLASRLLRAAMLDSEEFRPRREALLFSRLIDSALDKLDQPADRKRVSVTIPIREVAVFADRELILTSLVQLIDNAIKYSEPESLIDISFIVGKSEVVLKVRSKGLVVSPQERERIFERFYRAPETHHLPAGTGLGLSIVKKIVEAHHGSVWAEGETDYGTSFSLSLPVARAS
ncbi:MAG TPA: ATP-binding protein [Bryobacteraceae bacterium]|jgi:two-component system sensor histidine kinase KdpD|nr:ATP-binding protein [Bryobacteraceae bacterium]